MNGSGRRSGHGGWRRLCEGTASKRSSAGASHVLRAVRVLGVWSAVAGRPLSLWTRATSFDPNRRTLTLSVRTGALACEIEAHTDLLLAALSERSGVRVERLVLRVESGAFAASEFPRTDRKAPAQGSSHTVIGGIEGESPIEALERLRDRYLAAAARAGEARHGAPSSRSDLP